MNASTPASVPDFAALVLPMAMPSESKTAIPGSAPTPCRKAGAETPPSFGSALAEILASARECDNKPDEQESKTLITGVAETLPPCVAPPAPLCDEPSLPSHPVRVQAECTDLSMCFEPVMGGSQNASPVVPRNIPTFPTAVPVAPPQLPADTPDSKSDAPVPPAAKTELPHAAFAETFTPAAADVPPLEPGPAAIRMAAPASSQQLPKSDPAAMVSAAADAPPAAIASPDKPDSSGRAPEQHHSETRDRDEAPRQADNGPAPRASLHAESVTPAFASPKPAPAPDFTAHVPAPPSNLEHAVAEPIQQQHAPVPHTGDARTISLWVTDAVDQKVELRISDHAGEVKVAVRASDPDLAGTLRENLGELVHKLEQSGFRADNWHPVAPDGPAQVRQTAHGERESPGGEHSGAQQQNQHEGGDRRRQDRQQRPAWIQQLETSFKSNSERSSNTWLRA